MRLLFGVLLVLAWSWSWPGAPSLALDAAGRSPGPVWTAIIPDAFPRYVYRWQIRDDGTYREDGRDAATGTPIESTLSGHWRRKGLHLVLRQDDQRFVFDGVVVGSLYTGALYFNGRSISGFCAARGQQAPRHCSAAPRVATVSSPDRWLPAASLVIR
ncbi:MAG: hypothetical protein ACRECL_00635 [Bradyrhizobium sp.]